jgi:hypothetical protein
MPELNMPVTFRERREISLPYYYFARFKPRQRGWHTKSESLWVFRLSGVPFEAHYCDLKITGDPEDVATFRRGSQIRIVSASKCVELPIQSFPIVPATPATRFPAHSKITVHVISPAFKLRAKFQIMVIVQGVQVYQTRLKNPCLKSIFSPTSPCN